MRFLVMWRDEFRCVYCGRSRFEDRVKLNVDHLVPVSKGGTFTYDNFVTACADCNAGKNSSILSEAILERIKRVMAENTKRFSETTDLMTFTIQPTLLVDDEEPIPLRRKRKRIPSGF